MQAEDEIAAANLALGAAFGGGLGVTGTSGPGMDLKSETVGLAVALELPMVIVDVQRAGPSTGMPTKNEAADLLMAMYGRHGESPIPIVAAYTPAQCFDAAIEAARIAIRYRTPVILLTDTFLANSSEPWLIPDVDSLPEIDPSFATEPNSGDGFLPYLRDEKLARPWAVPGTPGLEHRIGGLEKEDGTGNISYDPMNHELMTHLRAAKVAKIADGHPAARRRRPRRRRRAARARLGLHVRSDPGSRTPRARDAAGSVATAHLVHLSPFPANLGDVLASYGRVFVPELNMGQLSKLVRADFLVPAEALLEGAGAAAHGRRARAGDREAAVTMATAAKTDKKAWESDQDPRWCPGCGDYAILSAVAGLHAGARAAARADRLHRRHRLLPAASPTT